MAHDGLNAVRFRPFNHTAPGQSDQFVVPAFAAQIARIEKGLQEPVVRVGNLDAQRDFLDARDVVEAYVAALFTHGSLAPGTIVNLASGVPRRIGDILERLLLGAKAAIRVEPDPALIRANDTPRAIGDAARARALLGWLPAIPWDRTLVDVLNDQRGRG
jgi:GDP-4-dehydro-6-deoxy-D-mannose reductase